MEIRFTKHALIRMKEREIVEDEIYEIFENPILAFEKDTTIVIGKTNHHKILTLVMDIKKRRLITLWPSSRQERQLYQEKVGAQ